MLQAFLYVYSQRDCDPLLLGFFALPDEDIERCFSNSSSYFWWDFADHHVVSQPSPRQMWGHALPYADRLVVTRFALGSHSSLLVVGVFQRSESPLKVYRFLRKRANISSLSKPKSSSPDIVKATFCYGVASFTSLFQIQSQLFVSWSRTLRTLQPDASCVAVKVW